ncbi:MAG: hypothetical protein PVS2B2_07090 [Candidatus Acidiferrum sp.]
MDVAGDGGADRVCIVRNVGSTATGHKSAAGASPAGTEARKAARAAATETTGAAEAENFFGSQASKQPAAECEIQWPEYPGSFIP